MGGRKRVLCICEQPWVLFSQLHSDLFYHFPSFYPNLRQNSSPVCALHILLDMRHPQDTPLKEDSSWPTGKDGNSCDLPLLKFCLSCDRKVSESWMIFILKWLYLKDKYLQHNQVHAVYIYLKKNKTVQRYSRKSIRGQDRNAHVPGLGTGESRDSWAIIYSLYSTNLYFFACPHLLQWQKFTASF